MPSIDHVHLYVKYKKRPGYFRCAAPNCTHIADKEFLEGKHSTCNLCGAVMTLSKEDLRRAKPRCIECSNTKKAKDLKKLQELTMYIGTSEFDDGKQAIIHFEEPYNPDLDDVFDAENDLEAE
jgi:hypothetical protein